MEEKEDLRKELKESADRMAEFKNAGMYEKEAEEHIKYSEITEKIEAENKYYEEEDLIAEIEEGREELNNSAKYMQQLKENGYYDRESAEHVRYSEIARKLSNSEQKLAGIQAVRNEKVAKLQNELTKSANKMREYEENGFYDQEAAEYSNYSEIISEIDAVKRINHRDDNREKTINNPIKQPIKNDQPIHNGQPIKNNQPIQLDQQDDNKNNKLVVFGTGIGYTIKKILNKIKKLFRKFIKNNIEADAEYEEYESSLENNDNKSAESTKEYEFKDLSKQIEKTTLKALKQKTKEEKKRAKEEQKNAKKSQTKDDNLENSKNEVGNTTTSSIPKNNGRSSIESDVLDEKIKRHLDSVAKTQADIYQRQQEKSENKNNQNDKDIEDR